MNAKKESTLEIEFPDHPHNNEESDANFQSHKKYFTKQALKVLELMHDGKELTSYSAMLLGIGHLPSAIRHLKKKINIGDRDVQIDVSDGWVREEGKPPYKKWFITPLQKEKNLTTLQLIKNHQNENKNGNS